MPNQKSPLLAWFAISPPEPDAIPAVEIDRSTGLLHRLGTSVPFVEELVQQKERWRHVVSAETILSRAADPIDPDLVRSCGDHTFLDSVLATNVTKAFEEPDPDLLRSGGRDNGPMGALSTNLTKAESDQPDPDLIRLLPRHCPSKVSQTF